MGDAKFYQRRLTDDSLIVFAEPVVVMIKANDIQTSAVDPRWAEVRLKHFLQKIFKHGLILKILAA